MKRIFRSRDYCPDPEEDIREELQGHIEMKTQELMASGLDPEEARAEAERRFGELREIQEEALRYAGPRVRRQQLAATVAGLGQDVRFALRMLKRNQGFAILALITLALGIGASTTIYSVADAALLRPLPFPEADRLVFLQGAYLADEGPRIRGASIPESRDWAQENHTLEGAAAFAGTVLTLSGDESAERVQGETVDRGYFQILGVSPLRGRTFSPEEYAVPGSPPVALVSEGLWNRRWGRSPGLLGRSVDLDGQSYTIVGILPGNFAGATLQAEVWIPLASAVESRMDSRGTRWLGVVGRMLPGRSPADVQKDLDAVAAGLQEAFPEAQDHRGVVVQGAREAYLGSTRRLILVVFAATALLLLISGINVTNLLLVRASARREEMSVRAAIGAGSRRLFRQVLSESLVLAGLGAIIGLVFAWWGIGALRTTLPPDLLPPFVTLHRSDQTFLFGFGLALLVGTGAGIAPAFSAARGNVARNLRVTGSRSRRLQDYLVIGEVSLALLLLVGAGLMTRSFRAQLNQSPGFDPDDLLAFRLQMTGDGYEGDALLSAVEDLRRRLVRLPGVEAVSFASDLPMRGLSSANYLWLPGRQDEEDRVRFYVHRVGPDYFRTLGSTILLGRAFGLGQAASAPDVVMISQAFARRWFPDTDPVGQTLNIFGPGENPVTIVGVAGDVRYRGIRTDPMSVGEDPDVYLPWVSIPGGALEFLVRSQGRPEAVFASIRAAVGTFDDRLVPYRMQPMLAVVEGQTTTARAGSAVLGLFSAAALLLAAIGVYGVLAFSVRRRRREMAIRVAVGAPPVGLVRLVILRALGLVGVGLAVGLGAAFLLGRSLESLLYGVLPLDPLTYGVTVATILLAGSSAAVLPAVRAARVDPQDALRTE